jgi:hypothetical protein
MNSLEFIEGETPMNLMPMELADNQDSPLLTLQQNYNSSLGPQNNYISNYQEQALPEFNQLIQQKIGLLNQVGLQEIKEVSTVHEKSCSTSKILSSNMQSRIMNNSFMRISQSNILYFK